MSQTPLHAQVQITTPNTWTTLYNALTSGQSLWGSLRVSNNNAMGNQALVRYRIRPGGASVNGYMGDFLCIAGVGKLLEHAITMGYNSGASDLLEVYSSQSSVTFMLEAEQLS